MADQDFARLVSLACHDLRTPLATVNGFAKTLTRGETLGEREAHFVDLIESAADQMTGLLDLLGLAARIESGRYEPALADVNTLDLVADGEGSGETIETDGQVLRRALDALAHCAVLHGGGVSVSWVVDGRRFALSPITPEAAPVVTGETPRDLGALVARLAIEALGGSLAVDGETLVVTV